MNLDTQRTALLSLVCSAIGTQTVWEDDKRPHRNPGDGVIALCKLDVAAAVGVDERRTVYDATRPLGKEMRETINGTRRCTFTVRVDSFEQDANKTALRYLETLRTRLASQWVRDELFAADMALWSTAQVIPLNPTTDDHVESSGALDVILGLMINEADARFDVTTDAEGNVTPGAESPVETAYIDHIVITDSDDDSTFTVDGP